MRWAWKVGRYAGIDVYVHATFLLLIAFVVMSHWAHGHSLPAVLEGVFFVLLLFLCVLLHEFGHALAARRCGVATRDITLYPVGGVARLERMPENPRHELGVALAGPLVNVVLAILLFGWLGMTSSLEPLRQVALTTGSFLERLAILNLALASFNLIPAFPMDGGRVLRAFLAMHMEYTRATQVAANLGQALAFLFGFVGMLFNPMLLFVALFVWIGAAQENSMVQMHSALGGIPVQRAMLTEFHVLVPGETLQRAVDLVMAGFQHDFPVVSDGRVEGILTRSDLFTALSKDGTGGTVESVMRRDFQVVEESEMLEVALTRLHFSECQALPVVREGRLQGLLSLENVGEFLMIQSALHRKTLPSSLLSA